MLDKSKPVDPRVIRTHQLLTDALMELLKEKPFGAVSVRDIVERATLNRTTFYTHFEDKYALLNYMIGEKFQVLLAEQLPACPRFCEDHLRLLVITTAEFLAQFATQCQPNNFHQSSPPIEFYIHQHLYQVVCSWIEPDSNPALASVISWGIWGTAFQWVRRKERMSPAVLADQVVPLIVSGVHPYFG